MNDLVEYLEKRYINSYYYIPLDEMLNKTVINYSPYYVAGSCVQFCSIFHINKNIDLHGIRLNIKYELLELLY